MQPTTPDVNLVQSYKTITAYFHTHHTYLDTVYVPHCLPPLGLETNALDGTRGVGLQVNVRI